MLITLIPFCSNATFIDFELSFIYWNFKVQTLVEDLDSQAVDPVGVFGNIPLTIPNSIATVKPLLTCGAGRLSDL